MIGLLRKLPETRKSLFAAQRLRMNIELRKGEDESRKRREDFLLHSNGDFAVKRSSAKKREDEGMMKDGQKDKEKHEKEDGSMKRR